MRPSPMSGALCLALLALALSAAPAPAHIFAPNENWSFDFILYSADDSDRRPPVGLEPQKREPRVSASVLDVRGSS